MSQHTGIRLAEVGFLLVIIAGLWLASAQVPRFRSAAGTIGPGIVLAAGGVLLVVATHWGHFG